MRWKPFFSNSSEIFFTARKFTGEASRKDNNLLIILYVFIIFAKIMRMSAMKTCFQIAECSLSYAKIQHLFYLIS
ncbi:MAG: hypothetical protein EGR93_05710 [Prevotella sp.]|nr:hypothetical protein [Prevotella sp.]